MNSAESSKLPVGELLSIYVIPFLQRIQVGGFILISARLALPHLLPPLHGEAIATMTSDAHFELF